MHGLAAECVERFRADLQQLTSERDRIGLAVSGGPDSVALLLLAHAVLPDRIHVATVDHGLRPEAQDEALFVAGLCKQLAVPHQILRPATPISGSIQTKARAVRYGLLAEWAAREGCDWIATAHHVDDQAETLMMRLNRGAGVAGLAGVRRVNQRIIRPLLNWRRSELVSLVADAGIEAVNDPSNADPRYDRVRMRAALAASEWLDPDQIANSAHHLAEANSALEWSAAQLAKERFKYGAERVSFDPSLLPREFRRRLTLLALARIDPGLNPRGDALSALVSSLEAGKTSTLGKVKCAGGVIWKFSPAPARRTN